MPFWRLTDRTLEPSPERPLAAAIVNVTDDSMFEGARSGTPERAVADGARLIEAGFDLIDVGAVAASSGPPVATEREAARLIPAVRGLRQRLQQPITADTFNTEVAARALAAGAHAINDVSGGDDEMLELVAETGCGYVLMHIEGPPREDRPAPAYPDLLARLAEFFSARIERAGQLGVPAEAIAIDPGMDFDLSTDHAVEILADGLPRLRQLGRPIFMSLSRKDFIGALLAGSWEGRAAAAERGPGTFAATALAVAAGAEIHRLHDLEGLDAVRVAAAIAHGPPSRRSGGPAGG
jgi:dihydropteroate synthase